MTAYDTQNDTLNQLAARIDQLEVESARTRRSLRRTRAALGSILAVGTLGVLAAATAPQAVVDLVRAERLEIVDADGALVAAIGAEAHGGQLDIWTAEGRNVMRATSNQHGGDIAVWHRNGANLFGAYASEQGGALGIWNAQGVRGVEARATHSGGALHVANAAGSDAAVLDVASNVGRLAMSDPDGNTRAALHTDDEGTVKFNLKTVDGAHASTLVASDAGCALSFDLNQQRHMHVAGTPQGGQLLLGNPSGHTVAQLGTDSSGTGFATLAHPNGATMWNTSRDDQGVARTSLLLADQTLALSFDAIPETGARLNLFNHRGRRLIAAGAAERGGLLNIMDHNGNLFVTAGHSDRSPGGSIAIRNRRGLQILHLGSGENEAGIVQTWDADGDNLMTLPKDR